MPHAAEALLWIGVVGTVVAIPIAIVVRIVKAIWGSHDYTEGLH